MSLLEFEKKYWESLDNQQKQLLSLYEEIKSNASISLKKKILQKQFSLE